MKKPLTDTIIYRATDWIAKLAYVNFLWIGFTLLGGVLLGLFPATVALFYITRKWVLGDQHVPLAKSFSREYRKGFWKANAIGYTITGLGGFLFADVFLASTLNTAVGFWLTFLFSVLLLLCIMTAIFLFPLIVHLKESFYNYFKFAFLIGISSLHYVLFIVIATTIVAGIFVLLPAAAIFFSASLFALIITKFAVKAFERVERKQRLEGDKVQAFRTDGVTALQR